MNPDALARLDSFTQRCQLITRALIVLAPEAKDSLIHDLSLVLIENRAIREGAALQLAACDCAAMMDTAETHAQNYTVKQGNPSWSPAFDSVMRRTAECIKLRAEVAALTASFTPNGALARENETLRAQVREMTAALDDIHTTAHCISKAGPLSTPDLASAWNKFDQIAVKAARALAAARKGTPP